jgi:tol-pal system protein YbgF
MRFSRRLVAVGAAVAMLAMPLGGLAQDRAQTLADVRQELTVLHVEIQRLKRELNTTGGATAPSGAGTLLDRVNAIEAQVQRLTGKTEELEFRINQIVKDGTNRIGDLEFRLVDLEGGDVTKLGETSTLGGGALPDVPTTSLPTAPVGDGGGQLAIGEQADYDAALTAFNTGDYALAADLFAAFAQTYTGGPMSGEAQFLLGEALARQGLVSEAARAYLDSFSGNPDGARAPEALLKLGAALGELGQVSEACVTLGEVLNRFPASSAVSAAQAARQALGCD